MKLHVHSNLWRQIHFNILTYHVEFHGDLPTRKEDIENLLYTYNVKVHKSFEGRWEEIEILLDEEEITLFLLRFA